MIDGYAVRGDHGGMSSSLAAWARTNEPLLWLAGAGHEVRRDDSYRFNAARRGDQPHTVLQLTLSGAGFYRRRRRVLLGRGMAFLDVIPGPFHYGFASGQEQPYELVYVSMHGTAVDQWRRRIVRSFGNILHIEPDGSAASLMLDIARNNRRSDDRYLNSARVYQLLMTLMSELRRRQAAGTRMDHVMQFIAAAAGDPDFSVSRLAREMDMSREHFSRRFRQAVGVGPRDYLAQHRLRHAARMMRDGDEKLDNIARACGLGSANYLCRLFRRRVGVTPAQFRARPWLAGP